MPRILVTLFAASLALAARPATAQTTPTPPATACDASSPDSPPGRAWWAAQRWRYGDDAAANAAYARLYKSENPWPDWFTPETPAQPGWNDVTLPKPMHMLPPIAALPVGMRFQMAIARGQSPEAPGGWGTFDYIRSVEDVRNYLAVTWAFMNDPAQVVVYEIVRPLPAWIGPIGPQIDSALCRYLPGGWSQINMMVKREERMSYLRVIDVRDLQ